MPHNNVALNTIRGGVSLISGLLAEADAQSVNPNGKVSNREVQNLVDMYGDAGAEFDKALKAVRKYAAERLGGDARRGPTVAQVNQALQIGMRQIARAAQHGELSTQAYNQLAFTWKKIVDFAVRYDGYSVSDLTQPSE